MTRANDAEHAAPEVEAPLLRVHDLAVIYAGGAPAVDHVSFDIRPGETLALVGESGCGKSTTAFALMGLGNTTARMSVTGRAEFRLKQGGSCDLVTADARTMRRVRGHEIAMIFQDPMSSLNPVYTVGGQMAEAIRLHEGVDRRRALEKAVVLLEALHIPNPRATSRRYPHEISGGMRQRVMIGIALSCKPSLLIADEPTTALDVTVQAEILDLLRELQESTRMAMLFITHNLGVVAEIADRAMVMYAGKVVESGRVAQMFDRPRMPYTRALLESIPRLSSGCAPLRAIPGHAPSGSNRPGGCSFHPRCENVRRDLCDRRNPVLEACGSDHLVACLRWRDILLEHDHRVE